MMPKPTDRNHVTLPTAREDAERAAEISSTPQTRSAAYRLAYTDVDFLMRDEARPLRLQLELLKPELELQDQRVESTIVVFGSARIGEDGEGQHGRWYAEARAFGRLASERGGAMQAADGRPRDNVIATGGGPGIMGAANRGAHDAGAPSIGFNITLPHEQEPNPWSTPELTFRFHYFAMRKMHLAMRANALVVFPGGFGTFDELFELLTLRQTDKSPPIPIILFDEAYWRSVINFDVLIEHGMIAAGDVRLFRYAEDAEGIWQSLLGCGLKPGESIE